MEKGIKVKKVLNRNNVTGVYDDWGNEYFCVIKK